MLHKLSARIGDAQDHWQCGVVSCVNDAAARLGLAPGQSLRDALLGLQSLRDALLGLQSLRAAVPGLQSR